MGHQTAFWVFVLVAAGLFGLLIGSFLNVVIYRVPRGMSVATPPSHCPTCGTELRPWDNVPIVSWLVLGARCRTCRTPIAVRYPLVEATTGVAFVALAWTVPTFWALPSLLVVAASTIAAAGIDADRLPVPWAVAVAGGVGAVALIVVAAATHQPGRIGWATVGLAAAVAASLVVDRSPSGLHRAAMVAALGWSAGWLWPSAGAILAAWILVTASAVAFGDRRSTRTGRAALPRTTTWWRIALWGGSLVIVVTAAALSAAG